jgi:hypothetical protein
MYLGGILLLLGGLAGWVVPALGGPVAQALLLDAPLAGSKVDVSSYLGADITALAVIIAVLIGFNVAGLQIAGQALSLSLVRAWLLSLTPFLLCWSATTTVALVYFLEPPTVMGQLWQMLLWFGAVVLLMIGYLWNLPWQLSGEYAADWALRALRGRPVAEWEALDGYSVLQTGVASASGQGELVTVRVMAMAIGNFLARTRDGRAERENVYDRRRYRALKNLLSGAAQHIAAPPNAIAYYLGHLTAGALLQAAAVGHPVGDAKLDLFSGLFRAIGGERERVDPLWTGMRHALCRKGPHGDPYLLTYWREHQLWSSNDARRTERLAAGMLLVHAHCCRILRLNTVRSPAAGIPTGELRALAGESAGVADETIDAEALLLIDLYRDLAMHLRQEVASGGSRAIRHGLNRLPLLLLEGIHRLAQDVWFPQATQEDRDAVSAAYSTHHDTLVQGSGAREPAPATAEVAH